MRFRKKTLEDSIMECLAEPVVGRQIMAVGYNDVHVGYFISKALIAEIEKNTNFRLVNRWEK